MICIACSQHEHYDCKNKKDPELWAVLGLCTCACCAKEEHK